VTLTSITGVEEPLSRQWERRQLERFCLCNSGERSAKGLTEEAASVEPLVKSGDLENPMSVCSVNDCAPFAIAWKKGFFRKYGLNVKLNRKLATLVTGLFWSP